MMFCNVDFNVKNKLDLFQLDNTKRTKIIITANAAFIVEANNSKRFFDILNNNHVTFDGRIPYIIAKLFSYLKCISSQTK